MNSSATEPRSVYAAFQEWLEAKASEVRIRTTLPVIERGEAIALHVWYDQLVTRYEYTYAASPILPSLGNRTTYVYSAEGVRVSPPSAEDAGQQNSQTPANQSFVVELKGQRGKSIRWCFEAQTSATPTESANKSEQVERAFLGLANAIEMIPLLAGQWRLTWVVDRDQTLAKYCYSSVPGAVRLIREGQEPQDFEVSSHDRLIRIHNPEGGEVAHVAEPTSTDVVYDFDALGNLSRSNPPDKPRRVL